MFSFLKGNSKNVVATKEPTAEELAARLEGVVIQPNLSQFRIADGYDYVPLVAVSQNTVEAHMPTVNHVVSKGENGQPLEVMPMADYNAIESALREASEPFRTQFATPYAQGAPFNELGFSTVLLPLMEWPWQTRRYVIEQCHLAWERYPLAKTAMRYNKLFSVQNGFTMVYKCKQVEDILEKFINDPRNNVRECDKTFVDALGLDGELFIRYSIGERPDENGVTSGVPGEVVITPMRPWYILWIAANPNNFREVYSYRYAGSISDGSGMNWTTFVEDVPADEVAHFPINRLPYEQRGRPELFSILPYLQGYRRWLEDRARQNAFRGAVADVTVKSATPGQVAAVAARYTKPMMAGTTNVHNEFEQFQLLEQMVGASDASEDGRQLRLMIAAGMGLPEYMLADGSNANLASATAQQLPALKSFGEWQDIMRNIWTTIFKRVIEENVKAGLLPEEVLEERPDGEAKKDAQTIKTVDAFEVQYSDLESIDTMNTVQAIMTAVNAGLVSDQTATSLLPWDLDYTLEQERLSAEQEQAMNDMLAGKVPMPPGANPATGAFGQPQIPGEMQDDGEEEEKPEDEYEQVP